MMSTIIELIGLPGTGKSHWARSASKHHNETAGVHIISLGVDRGKFYNTLYGCIRNPLILCLLTMLLTFNFRRCFSFTEIRPYLVVLERLGRNRRMKLSENGLIHVDEGAFQFVWRIFCNLELNNINLFIGRLILIRLCRLIDKTEYFLVGKVRHLERVNSRKKVQKFDVALRAGDVPYIKSCRASMYCLVVFLRSSSATITVRRN